ncbi:MAG TPA: hypothetical protein PLO33_08280 [Kouleothrix sp.]|uniref:hypothetical protein n=1 Tax=Kouleothrix sp. TaxID=2779161 RepID=UPI002BA345B6|nr:hypothetical protein [Kouleothrix sp.]HRC75662.1 hypothetical protein [Kouleothrix sp.]
MSIAEPPYAALHTAIVAERLATIPIDDAAHEDYAVARTLYRQNANHSLHLDQVVALCERRAVLADLPLDLVAAYITLAALARWRIRQLQAGPLVQS